jgi:RHS repeat-associated protein
MGLLHPKRQRPKKPHLCSFAPVATSKERANFSQTRSEIERCRFTSKEYDEETGLYYMSARYQNPMTSRWMSADPSGFDLIKPMEKNEGGKFKIRSGFKIVESMNPYSYCGNNPVIYNDPAGEQATATAGVLVLGGEAAAGAGFLDGVILFVEANPWIAVLLLPLLITGDTAPSINYSEANDISEEDKEKIANGHAEEKHKDELGADSPEDIVDEINDVLEGDWTEKKEGERGRTAYYNPESEKTVIHDPNSSDKGTIFLDRKGEYFYTEFE